MSGDPSCCLSCAVHNGDVDKLKKLLDSSTLSDSQVWFLGACLLRKAVIWLFNFLNEPDAGADSESELKSEMTLYWNGTPVGSPDGTNNIEIMVRISKVNNLVDKPTTCHEYLGSLQMAALINNTEITEVLLGHLRRKGTLLRCDVPISNLKTLKLLLQSIMYVDERSDDRDISLSIAMHVARIEISKVLFNPLYFNKPDELYSAAEMNRTPSMEELLSLNADVEARFHDLTPLHISAQLGHTRSAEFLLAHGANPESVCDSAFGVLLHAAVKESKDTLGELLLRKGVNINPKDNCTLLHLAAAQRCGKVFKLLWNNGPGIDEPDENNKNILCLAVERHDSPLIEHIIEAHSDLGNNRDEMQCNILEALRRKGFEISPRVERDCRLFHAAVRSGSLKIVEYLLNYGTNFNDRSKSEYNVTPLHTAVKFKQIEIVRLLINNKADVNAKTSCGKSPLHYAFEMVEANEICTRDIAKILLDSGARVDEHDQRGTTALQIAAEKGHQKVVELLCKYKADVNFGDNCNKTPLHYSVRSGNEIIVKILLDEGANVNAAATDRETPIWFAVSIGYAKVVKLLMENGADIIYTYENAMTLLHIAASHDNLEIVEMLLNAFDDVDCRDGDGQTALCFAACFQRVEIVRLLLDHGSDVSLLRDLAQALGPHTYSDEINRIFTEHRVKMMALSPRVSENYLHLILIENFNFYTQCTIEIERMRQRKIGVSNVSYYDLLTKGMSRLALYSRNKDIVDALEKEDHGDMFHLYSAMLRNRFKNGQKRASLLESSSKSLRDLTEYSLPDTPFIKLCDYLTNGDLRNLIKAACNVSDN